MNILLGLPALSSGRVWGRFVLQIWHRNDIVGASTSLVKAALVLLLDWD